MQTNGAFPLVDMTALIALLIRLLLPTLRMREALRRMASGALRVLIDVEAGCFNALTQDQLTQMDGALRGYEVAMARLICGHGYYRAGCALPDLPPPWLDWVGDPRATHAGVLARVSRLLQLIDGLDRYADRHMQRLERVAGPLRLARDACDPPPPASQVEANVTILCVHHEAGAVDRTHCVRDGGGLQPRASPFPQRLPHST